MKIIVVGGGAAGMMVSCALSTNGHDVILIEHKEKLGSKVFITGKGRCNLTNFCDKKEFLENVVVNSKFLTSSIYNFGAQETINFFNNLGLETKVERGNRVFPLSDKSSDVIKVLNNTLIKNNCEIHFNTNVEKIIIKDSTVQGVIANGEKIFADIVVFATGGKTYTSTGSDGSGYKILQDVGHTLVPPKPALVPLICVNKDIKKLSGLSLKNITASVYIRDSLICSEFGEMLFTHTGFSGPIILTISSKITRYTDNLLNFPCKTKLVLDLKPALDIKILDNRILRDFMDSPNKEIVNVLPKLMPKALIEFVLRQAKINQNEKINNVSKEKRNALLKAVKGLEFDILSTDELNVGIVTSGGININEINPKDMQSKIIKGLYVCGEVLDVDAVTGGFNLQIAFSTAMSVAKGINNI